MNPLVAYILSRPRADWFSAAVRAGAEALVGPLSAAEYSRAVDQADRSVRATEALLGSAPDWTVAQAVRGILRAAPTLIVPVVVTAIDAVGVSFSFVVDVAVPTSITLADMEQLIQDQVQIDAALYGAQTYDIGFDLGSYVQ